MAYIALALCLTFLLGMIVGQVNERRRERKRCAAIADRFKATMPETSFARGQHNAAFNIALAIREPDQSKWAATASQIVDPKTIELQEDIEFFNNL